MPRSLRKLCGLGLATAALVGSAASTSQAQGLPPAPSEAPAAEGVSSVEELIPRSLSSKPDPAGANYGSASVGPGAAHPQSSSAPARRCVNCQPSHQGGGNLVDYVGAKFPHLHSCGYGYGYCDDCSDRYGDDYDGSHRGRDYLSEKFNRDRLRARYGYFIPEGSGGQGTPWLGAYHMGYAVNPYHFDPRDAGVYAAQGYGVPMTVPLAPNVEHQYNYGWGVPSSRLTGIYRYVREPGVVGPEALQGAYPSAGPMYGNAHPFVGYPGR